MIRVSAAVARMRRKGCTRRHHIARWLLLWESEFITATLQCWLNRWKGGQDTNWSQYHHEIQQLQQWQMSLTGGMLQQWQVGS